ncbi:ABC transporter substrate-binding protein [Phytoactinopolyspora halophila]|nr:ABC transporter substrate-binding protein [Phytoactinopolyspora halophila]
MRQWRRFLVPLAGAGLVLAACTEDVTDDVADGENVDEAEDTDDADSANAGEFPRNETVYTGGAEWGTYEDWNPNTDGEATFVRGFLYETLFWFDPWEAELKPWLAESGEWIEEDVYEVALRDGITWHDGEQLTADDVKFTFDLRDVPGVEFPELDEWLDEVEVVDDLTVRFHFSDPRAGQWDNVLYDREIVPEHTWGEMDREEIPEASGEDITIGSGAYEYHSHDENRARYERYDDWWATEHLGLEMAARYVVDFRNESNEVAMSQILQNELDLSNFFLPGINQVPEFGESVHTFYSEEPYMLSANTASLIPNHDRSPTDDADLRRALAFSIDVDDIVDTGYQGIVEKADPTGMLPLWLDQGFRDDEVVEEHGFSYDPEEAERILDEAGYVDEDGDGWRETPDGEDMELDFIVPSGWTDWELAAEVIEENLHDVGVNVVLDFVDPGQELDPRRDSGDYDLVFDNQMLLQNHLFAQYFYLYELPVLDEQANRDNPHRVENEHAWELTQELARLGTPPTDDPDDDERFMEIVSELQEITLEDMVIIPLWYNGLWSQVNDSTWTNWPSDDPDTPNYYPTTWANEFMLGGLMTFTEIEPAG